MPTVLIVDDDEAIRSSLERALRLHAYETALAADGLAALKVVQTAAPDAVVLDVSMPGMDGLAVCRRFRQDGHEVPVLMLTARDAVDDRVAGLDAGADDYLVKPFALEELLARLRAILRRRLPADTDRAAPALVFADLAMDLETLEVRRGQRYLELTRTEFQLLELFLENPRVVLTREVILDRVWGFDAAATTNAIEVYVGYLRRKLEAAGEPRIIQTVRGMGYALREPS